MSSSRHSSPPRHSGESRNPESLKSTPSRHSRESGNPVSLLTDNLNIWSSATQTRKGVGRGSSKKLNLYGIKKLRELILELAVRGLLVPQDQNDEPASVLVEKLTKGKEKSITENRIKKMKELPEVCNEDVSFSMPIGWDAIRLGNAMNVINGRAYKKHEMLQEGTPLLRVGNLFTSNEWYFSDLELEDDKYIDNGDLIYAWSASFGPFIWSGEKVIYHYHIWKLDIFDQNALDKNYVLNYLAAITASIKASGNGIAMIHMTKERMEKIVLPIPPLPEQHRIVTKVDELMTLCDQLEQQQENSITAHKTLVETLLSALTNAADKGTFDEAWEKIANHFDTLFTTEHSIDQLKQTILQLAVMGKLVPQDPNDEPTSVLLGKITVEKKRLVKEKKIKKQNILPEITDDEKKFELPNGWEWSSLPDIGELARGKSKHRPRNDPSLYSGGNIKLVQTGDVARSNGVIRTHTALYNKKGLAQSRLWPKGTMCITIAANIADTGVLGFDACFPDSVVGFSPFDDRINVKYFEYFIRTAKKNLESYAPATAQKNINLEILGKLSVPLPPLEELNTIVKKVDKLMGLCDELKSNLSKAQIAHVHLADAMTENAIN